MEFRFSTGYFSIPNELIEKWSLTGLEPSDLLILSAFLKHAHGKSTEVFPTQDRISGEIGITPRHLRRRIHVMKQKGMLEILLVPGRASIIDLNPLKSFLATLKSPVDGSGKPSTTPDTHVRSTPDTHVRGIPREKPDNPEVNPRQAARIGAPNKQSIKKHSCRNNGASVDNARPGDSLSPPADPSNGAGNEVSIPDDLLERIAFSPSIPATVKKIREPYRSGIGSFRQRLETMIRLELRAAGIRTKIINEWFSVIPIDGMLFWLTRSYTAATKNQAGYIASMIERTRGEYPNRKGGV